MDYSVAIVGGGASGMVAAITAALAGKSVLLIERNEVLGKKILATGNGKCNFSNRNMKSDFYYSDKPERIKKLLEEYGAEKICEFFEEIGIRYKDKNGYLYPYSEQASCIRDMLEAKVQDTGVELVRGEKIIEIKKEKNRFCLRGDQNKYYAKKVIIACGGAASPKSGSDGTGYLLAQQLGQKVSPVYPSLVQLIAKEKYCKKLSGIRAMGMVSFQNNSKEKWITRDFGEIQLTDYGISGIPVFQISGSVNQLLAKCKQVKVNIDFLYEVSEDEIPQIAAKRLKQFGKRNIRDGLNGIVNNKLMSLCVELCGYKEQTLLGSLSQKEVVDILLKLKNLQFTITGSKTFEQAQVTRGGVYLSELDEGFQSKSVPGLYFCGEILNVDGICGGYNLHFAWVSAMVAGKLSE